MEPLPIALSVAGSDPSGGAGIQADLKTFTACGVYGAAVITALTAQNTTGVSAIEAPTPGFVAEQLRMVLADLDVAAAKTGMLFSAAIIEAVAPLFAAARFPLVVDPVCVATSGGKLLEDDAVQAMRQRMFPLAALLTPNRPEAELFAGMAITGEADVKEACRRMLAMGAGAVLLKGGHALSRHEATDWLAVPGKEPEPLSMPRVDTEHLHGTGCTLSAAVAAHLAKGFRLRDAVRAAQDYLNRALRAGFKVGHGAGPVNHLAPLLGR